MAISTLVPSPAGEISHNTVREKINEVITDGSTGYDHVTPANWQDILPDPIGGVITLTTGAYYFDGYVDISPNRIIITSLQGIVLRGETSLKDSLVSNCVGGAFIGGNNVYLATKNLSLEAGSADDVIAVTGSSTNLIMHFTDFFDYKNMVSFTDGVYFLYDNGFTATTPNAVSGFKFFGTPGIVYFTHCQAQSFKGTWIDLGTAVLSAFRLESPTIGIDNIDPTQLIVDGLVDSGNINPTKGGVGSITNAEIQDSSGLINSHDVFGNIKPKDIRWGIRGVPTMQDSRTFFELESENNLTATVLSDGVWTKIVTDSPVISPDTQRYEVNGGGDPEYIGLKTESHSLAVSLSLEKLGGSVGNYEIAAFKNANATATTGTKISIILPVELKNTAQVVSFSTTHQILTGDYIGLYIRPVGTNDNILVNADTVQIFGG
jgi:hypothetical protein